MRVSAMNGLFVGTLFLLLAAPAAGAAVSYGPCSPPTDFECGSLDLPLDRSGAVAGSVQISVRRHVAPTNPTATAVVALAGGPGQSAISLAPDFAQILEPALATRDLLVFDQRGTGASSPLHCSFRGASTLAKGRHCAKSLGPVRGLYTTAASVEDLEALRVQSGYRRLMLYGVSYGTKLALDYAARYPDNVESLVLDSVVLPDGGDPLLRPSFHAMPRMLSELCAAGACSGITAKPVGDLAAIVKRLGRRPMRAPLIDGHGRRDPGILDRSGLLNIVLTGDLNPTLRAELPGSVVAARRGDPAPLIRLAARAYDIIQTGAQTAGQQLNQAVFVATTCEETLFPWSREANANKRGRQLRGVVRGLGDGPFRPFDRATALGSDILGLCRGWPNATPAPSPPAALPDVPTLVLAGGADLRTPLEEADRVRGLIGSAQVLSVPFTGHSVLASDQTDERCSARALDEFLSRQPIVACAQALNPNPPTPVPPRALSRLKGTGGRGKVARTITAAMRTIADIRRQVVGDLLEIGRLPTRSGGLRGGYVTVSPSERLRLHGLVYVPGVSISGGLPLREVQGSARLRIRGASAAHGSLTIGADQITGHLAGRRVKLTMGAATAAGASHAELGALLRGFRLRRAG